VEALGIETPDTSAASVANRRENDRDRTTQDDARQREVSASVASPDPVEAALARALDRASEAECFNVVAQLARELEARRLARAANVVQLPVRRSELAEVRTMRTTSQDPSRGGA
jgi:hypothetical protein